MNYLNILFPFVPSQQHRRIYLKFPNTFLYHANDVLGKCIISFCFQICVDFKCQSYDQLNISKCPSVAGDECGGRGVS